MKLPRVGRLVRGREVFGEERVALAGGGAALSLTLLFGSQTLGLWLTSRAGYLVVPSAVGVPLTLPGLHVTEIGALGWSWTLWETAAALLLVTCTAVRLHVRRSRGTLGEAGAVRALFAGWWAFALAAAVTGAFRGAVTAGFAYAGPGGYLTYALFGALFGLLWGLVLGWLVGLAASAATAFTAGAGTGAGAGGGAQRGRLRSAKASSVPE